jgi:penicillin V acylase-like amidase (Ntn superfamily)
MPQPENSAEAAAFMEEAVDGVTVPAFDEQKHPNTPESDAWAERWRVVYDLRNLNLYFDETNTGKKLYIKISSIDFGAKDPKIIEVKDLTSQYGLKLFANRGDETSWVLATLTTCAAQHRRTGGTCGRSQRPRRSM